jgi:UDP-GlcNAc:undecaprenyl-phosphate GlcNAc-1-phosphate transferase
MLGWRPQEPGSALELEYSCSGWNCLIIALIMEISLLILYFAPVATFLLTRLILTWMLKNGAVAIAMDHPNDRSLHSIPTPRTGGLALTGGIGFGWVLLWQPWMLPIASCVLFITLVSFFDDVRSLSVGWRLLVQVLAAGVFVFSGLAMAFGSLWLLPIVIVTVWMTNLYNFMDGSDGLAGGMTLFGFGSYAAAAWLGGDTSLAGAMLCITAAALSFLRVNFHPARIFMGDVGSVPLGFTAAAIGVLGWERGDWGLWFPLLVFSPFIVDATITLFKRLLCREKIWQAHRSHYYQRLVQMGLGHRKTAIIEYCLMAVVGASAIWLMHRPMSFQLIGLAAWGAIYIFLALWIDRLWRAYIRFQHTDK